MQLLPCGSEALLAQFDSLEEALDFDAAVGAAAIHGVVETVPAARTVLVIFDPLVTGPDLLAGHLRRVASRPASPRPAEASADIEIPVVYDGPDLDGVARHLGIAPAEVVGRHTACPWRVGFAGFAPGFAYLLGDGSLEVPRRAEPRVRVPAGSVALAGEFGGIYPRDSPGGWQLIGRTDAVLWDAARPEPALLVPGRHVRFVAVAP